MRVVRLILVLLGVLSAFAAAAEPDLVLITLDTARADRFGFHGSKRGLTPNLDALAQQSTVFKRAYAQAPLTTVSHATIFTGTHPQYHRVNDFGIAIPAPVPTIAELLKSRGYQTAAFVGSVILDPKTAMAPGFDRGFDVYDAGYHRRRKGEDRYKSMERRAMTVVQRAVKWLTTKRDKKKPFFLWVHVYDPHYPYEAPAPFRAKYRRDPYDGEIAYTDAAMGTLLTALRSARLLSGAGVVVTADHGEALGEHGEHTHGVFLYDSTIHVPLVVKAPGQSAGSSADVRVSHTDILPTLLEWAKVPAPEHVQGSSLTGLATAEEPDDRPSYAETEYPRRAFGWSSLGALRAGKYLYVNAPKRELYDLESDPKAAANIAASAAPIADTLAARLEDIFKKYSSDYAASEQTVDADNVEKLRALGYVGGGRVPTEPGKVLADPKEKVSVANDLHDAMHAVESDRLEEGVALLRRVLAADPQIYAAQYQLGIALTQLGRPKEAIEPLRKALELLRDSAMAQYELGIALFESGQWKASVPHFEAAVAQMPNHVDAVFSLASVYARTERVDEAKELLQRALTIDAEHYRSNLLYGRLLDLLGQSTEALPYLETAARVQAKSAEARIFLADAYQKVGRAADAQRLRREAAALRQAAPATPN